MAIGLAVDKNVLDNKVAKTALALREAFEAVEAVNQWLINHPVVETTDPLTEDPFNYTPDEAYALRLYFETFDAVRVDKATTFNIGRKLTGLE